MYFYSDCMRAVNRCGLYRRTDISRKRMKMQRLGTWLLLSACHSTSKCTAALSAMSAGCAALERSDGSFPTSLLSDKSSLTMQIETLCLLQRCSVTLSRTSRLRGSWRRVSLKSMVHFKQTLLFKTFLIGRITHFVTVSFTRISFCVFL